MRKKAELNYWEKRFLSIEERREEIEKNYLKRMNERYDKIATRIKAQIDEWMEEYADEEGVSRDKAQKILSKSEQRTWSMDLKEFRQKAIDGGYEEQLNKEYYKSRITRLQRLERQLYFELAEIANIEKTELEAYLMETLDETYLQNIYELTDRGSFSITFENYSSAMLKEAVYKKWTGADFSQRVWGNHLKYLPKKLSRALAEGISQGFGTDKIVDKMMDGIDSNLRNRMITLVQTESAYIAEQASQKSYKETGVEQYMWLATLEIHTCDQCGELDSNIYIVGGANSPQPIIDTHPNCRCITVPYFEGFSLITRWQRDPVTSKGSLKSAQTFKDWKKKHIDDLGKDRWHLEVKMAKNRTQDRKIYDRYKKILGKEIPSSLSSFQEMKYNESERWNKIQDHYFVKARLKDGRYGTKINPEKQAPHMELTAITGKSYFKGVADVQKLFDQYAGTGKMERTYSGKRKNTEIIIAENFEGVSVDLDGSQPTHTFKIHHSKNRTHIVPIKKRVE